MGSCSVEQGAQFSAVWWPSRGMGGTRGLGGRGYMCICSWFTLRIQQKLIHCEAITFQLKKKKKYYKMLKGVMTHMPAASWWQHEGLSWDWVGLSIGEVTFTKYEVWVLQGGLSFSWCCSSLCLETWGSLAGSTGFWLSLPTSRSALKSLLQKQHSSLRPVLSDYSGSTSLEPSVHRPILLKKGFGSQRNR